jgi:hypothetical protein
VGLRKGNVYWIVHWDTRWKVGKPKRGWEGNVKMDLKEMDWTKLCVVRNVHFGMKLYNDQHNAQVFNLFIYLLPPYKFRAFF